MRFSANLGFLWKELPLPEAIRVAADNGFDAVECHWPFETPAYEIASILNECAMEMVSINVSRGNAQNGDFGLGAVPGRESECQENIVEAIEYASAIGCSHVHLMAGISDAENALSTFLVNLEFAVSVATKQDINILIEPINTSDVPGYYLTNTRQAQELMGEIKASNLRMMFDCYHVRTMEGDPHARLRECYPSIGHIQIAGWPGRGRPDWGELDYREMFEFLNATGWNKPLGAEYIPEGTTEGSLSWMETFSRLG